MDITGEYAMGLTHQLKRLCLYGLAALMSVTALFMLPMLWTARAASAHTPAPILYINSYSPGYLWSDNIMEGIRNVIDKNPDFELLTEFLDTKRHNTPEYLDMLAGIIAHKYRDTRFSAVITSDDNAYHFLLKHRREIAPDVPWVFCGINRIPPEMISRELKIYGIDENRAIKENIDMVLSLQPKIRNLVFISDHTETGHAFSSEARSLIHAYSHRVRFSFLSDLSGDELRQCLLSLSSDSAVIHMVFAKDRDGKTYPDSGLALVAQSSSVPVYTFREFLPSSRVAGGAVSSGVIQGEMAARTAIELAKGQDQNVSLLQKPPAMNMINYKTLQRFGIHNVLIPDNYVILNYPKSLLSLYREYKATVIAAAITIIILSVIIVILALNIRMRKTAQLELADKEELSRITLHSIGDGVITINVSGFVTAINHAAENLCAIQAEECKGLLIEEIFHVISEGGKPGKGIHPARGVLAKASQLQLHDCFILNRKDAHIHVSGSINPIIGHDRQCAGAVIAFRDIGEQRRIEEQLRQSQKIESIGQLAGGIAHDFNNMLCAIIGSASLLAKKLAGHKSYDNQLKVIIDASNRAADLTAKLLAFSRKSQPDKHSINVNKMLEEAIAILSHSIPKNIVIKCEADANPANVDGDLSQLQNAIINLGINARDAMPGGGMLTISSSNVFINNEANKRMLIDAPPGHYVQINVRDTGTGIKSEHLNRIFDPFFTTKSVGKGTGLGLSVVYGTVREMGGTIHVYSEPGIGSVFKIYLPLSGLDEYALSDGNNELITGSGNILVVDDEDLVRDFVHNSLIECGYNCLPAANGQQAIDIFKLPDSNIDLVILDMIMPGIPPTETFNSIHSAAPDIPFIIISGFNQDQSFEEIRANSAAFLAKPFTPYILSKTVHEVLNRQQRK